MIQRLLDKKMGFIQTPQELKAVVDEFRLHPCLIRCGNGRFTCPAQDVEHFTGIIKASGKDYIRDISVLRG